MSSPEDPQALTSILQEANEVAEEEDEEDEGAVELLSEVAEQLVTDTLDFLIEIPDFLSRIITPTPEPEKPCICSK